MHIFRYVGLLLLTGLVLFACESGNLDVGQSVINPQELTIQTVDTVTIRTSTVLKVDSFATSGDANGDLLVGRWTDPQTGTLTAGAFGSLDYTSNALSSQTNLRLDSLVLEMNYSFVYGDTTSLFDMSVHQLKSPMVAKVYYNTSSLPYETTPLLRKAVQPRPNSRGKQIRFRMSDELAQTLYTRLSNGQINDYVSLNRLLPGFAFVDKSSGNTLAGFTSNTSGLRLYYHTIDNPQESLSLLFPMATVRFTQLLNDRTGTPLSALKTRSDAVNSRLTDNTSFIVPGASLQTRIEFPYLNQFATPNGYADLNKALLVISPVRRNRFDNAPPPATLELFETNNVNALVSAIPEGTTGALVQNASSASAPYAADLTAEIFTDNYTFDLTYYIGQIIKYRRSNEPLILTVPPTSGTPTLRSLVQRVTLGNQIRTGDQMKLQLFLTSNK